MLCSERMSVRMFAEELEIVDAGDNLWRMARPLVDVALRMEREGESESGGGGGFCWHGWTKRQIDMFLANLPERCCLVVGVWETVPEEGVEFERDVLRLGVVCEIVEREVRSIRTFKALEELVATGLKPTEELEPGIDDALEILRAVRATIAPVAWALFTDKGTWDEWIFASGEDGGDGVDKGEMLGMLVRQGRCVLMGGRAGPRV